MTYLYFETVYHNAAMIRVQGESIVEGIHGGLVWAEIYCNVIGSVLSISVLEIAAVYYLAVYDLIYALGP